MAICKNESNLDRGVRVVVGIVVLSLTFWGPQTTLGYLGLIPLITGLLGVCPLYSVIGVKTCSNSK